jgi:hypothetical protein
VQIFYHKELSRVVEARPLCQIIGEMAHRIFDPRVVATAPIAESIGESETVAESGDDSNLQATMNKITMRIAYRSLRENVFAAIFRLLQVREWWGPHVLRIADDCLCSVGLLHLVYSVAHSPPLPYSPRMQCHHRTPRQTRRFPNKWNDT